MKIAVIGSGAMGSLFGGLLAKEAEVVLYSRNAQYVENVNKNGLIMTQGETRNVVKARATSDPAEIGEADVALVYVKYTGTKKAIQDALVSCIKENTIVLTLQNGIGNVDIIKEFVPEDQIVYGFSTLTSDTKAPGHIEMTTLKKVGTHMWPLNNKVTPKLEELSAMMTRVGLNTDITENINEKIWYKLMVNTSHNTLCAILKLTVSDLMYTPASFDLAKQIIYEVADVAQAKGINTNREKALQHVMKITESVPGHVPSMVLDVLNKKKTEIDCLNEAVVAEGKRLGIPTPMLEASAKMIRAIEDNYAKLVEHH